MRSRPGQVVGLLACGSLWPGPGVGSATFPLRRRASWDAAGSWRSFGRRWPARAWSASWAPGVSARRAWLSGSATDLGRGFADGAWWVDLAEIRDAALVTNAVVAALDLRDQAAAEPLQILLSQLRDSELLLVLDNCEHVLRGLRPPGRRRPPRCAQRAGDDHDPGAAAGAG